MGMVPTMLAEQGDQCSIGTPYDIFDRRGSDLRDCLLLLDIIEHHRRSGAENQACGSAVKDLVGLDGGLDRLHNRVGKVAYFDELRC